MLNLNKRAYQLCEAMVSDAAELRIAARTLMCGTRIVDCGIEAEGSIEAGRRLAEVCLAGLGTVQVAPEQEVVSRATGADFSWFVPAPLDPALHSKYVMVASQAPVAACMASQYAGWEIKGEKFFAMGSGPMRAAAGREKLFDDIGHREQADQCVGVLECGKLPPEAVCIDIAEKCGVAPERLTLLVARTASAAGTMQIVARSIETALHKLHVLGFDLAQIESGCGLAPLPPVADDDLTAIGWTNDAILYGGQVGLCVNAAESTIEELGPRVPSSASPDFGRPFAEIFARYGGDFYRIDPMLFSPAMISFFIPGRPRECTYGRLAPEVLAESLGGGR
jgi:methenyltetrahydromethanopterin cyclohydrolase